jgi:hypothetical protein
MGKDEGITRREIIDFGWLWAEKVCREGDVGEARVTVRDGLTSLYLGTASRLRSGSRNTKNLYLK